MYIIPKTKNETIIDNDTVNLSKYIKSISRMPQIEKSNVKMKQKWPLKGYIPPEKLRMACYEYNKQ